MKKIQEYVTSDVLKIIALVAMTLEHTGTILSGGLYPLVLLGRIAYPIFAYFIMYHLYQTGCFVKYIKRLTFFGILTGFVLIPFHMVEYHIFISFLLPILYLYLTQEINQKIQKPALKWTALTFNFCACLIISIPLNYSFLGFLYMVMLYYFLAHRTLVTGFVCVILGALLNPLNADYALVSGLTTVLLLIFPPQETTIRHLVHKWFYYLYYPIHLVILKGLSLF